MRLSSSGSSALVSTCSNSMLAPESWIAWIAPSMRGWMLSWPGVAMNRPTLPSPTSSTMRWPIATPEPKRSWPT